MNTPIDKHIYRLIADSTINVCSKSEFSTPLNMSEYIHGELLAGRLNTVSGFIFPTVGLVMRIYGMEIEEASFYVGEYFKKRKWETYHKPMVDYLKVFGKFLSN